MFISILNLVFVGVVALPLAAISLECLIALLPARETRFGEREKTAVLIPAHNEGEIIAETVRLLKPQLGSEDRIVVIADNCVDGTADAASGAGAVVIERFDEEHRGKTFALDHGVNYLKKDPPRVVLVFDADCTAEPGMVDRLTRVVNFYNRPAQGLYLMRPPKNAGPESLVSTLAFLVKNWVRPRALHRLGLPVHLTGSGMAFPWESLQNEELTTAEVVEDLALGLSLIRKGNGPVFCESARIWSTLPSNADVAVTQRTRWEHGYMGIMTRVIPCLLRDVVQGNLRMLPIACDLCVPPLSLLVLLVVFSLAITFNICLWTGAWSPFWVLTGLSSVFAALIIVSWFCFGRGLIPAHSLFSIPTYVLHKVSIYLGFIVNREKEWKRTKRDHELVDDDCVR